MAKYQDIYNAFIALDKELRDYLNNNSKSKYCSILDTALHKAEINNPWFTKENILHSLKGICTILNDEAFLKINQFYPKITAFNNRKNVGVVLAGNIPLVGFHDFLCVLISGHNFIGKQSSKDNILLDAISQILCDINPELKSFIRFEESLLKDIDAVIATGSNNTSKYFEYYFNKYPNIIRKNRNSVAVLTGKETPLELNGLSDDIMMYFGLGCRNVSKIYLPLSFHVTNLYEYIEKYNHYKSHNKYFNNYEYNRAIYLVNSVDHFDNNYLIFKEDASLSSPISVVFYEYYTDANVVKNHIENNSDKIQCVVSNLDIFEKRFNFGSAQYPGFLDFSDNIDTIEFLLNI